MHAAPAWTPKAMRDWQNAEASLVANGLSIRANGIALLAAPSMGRRRARVRAPEVYRSSTGRAITLHSLPARATISVRDSVYGDRRIGWKDILLPGLVDPTNELRSYPSALIGSPRQNDAATFDVLGAGRIAHVHVSGNGSSRMGLLLDRAQLDALRSLCARRTDAGIDTPDDPRGVWPRSSSRPRARAREGPAGIHARRRARDLQTSRHSCRSINLRPYDRGTALGARALLLGRFRDREPLYVDHADLRRSPSPRSARAGYRSPLTAPLAAGNTFTRTT